MGGVIVAGVLVAFAFAGSAASFVNIAHAGYGQEKVLVCHKGKTIEIASPAAQAHLNHGDTAGACPNGGPLPQ